jgi:hypothetical protein
MGIAQVPRLRIAPGPQDPSSLTSAEMFKYVSSQVSTCNLISLELVEGLNGTKPAQKRSCKRSESRKADPT